MKAVFVSQQLEYRFEGAQEEVRQGDKLQCTITVKNHSSLTATPGQLCLELVWGNPKEEQAGKGQVLCIAAINCDSLAPGASYNAPWLFELDKNSPITEKSQTIYIRFGSVAGQKNILPLTVKPNTQAQAVFDTLANSFQFLNKGEKAIDGWLEAKFKAPSGQRYSMVEELVMQTRFEEQALHLKFKFKVKRFDTASNTVGIKKAKIESEVSLAENQYLLPGGFVNYDGIEHALADTLKEVESGI